MSTPEGVVQSAILKYLQSKKIFHWRANNGAVYDAKIHTYRKSTSMPGVPDIICVIGGRFVGIECKAPKGRQSPEQFIFQQRIEEQGGIYILAKSVDDVAKKLPL